MIAVAQNPDKLKGQRRIFSVEDWTVWEYDSVTSTNLVAADLPAWSAVRADTQSAGRGRFQRTWVSDRGGLWLSAVVPTPSPSGRILPLLVGVAVCDVLHGLGVGDARLRWPNDVMVLDRKLAGVLIDQFRPGLAVIGIGLNVNNQPACYDATLQNHVQRLANILPAPILLQSLLTLLLRRIRALAQQLHAGEWTPLLSRVNDLWSKGRRVELDLDGDIRVGWFAGVDGAGRLLLQDHLGASTAYDPEQVRHLTEMPESHERIIPTTDSV
jgi:BirA family transcriptional regulator, biotin operon repressor / biotin---[acetyl-CoA-carboxylase] ligase